MQPYHLDSFHKNAAWLIFRIDSQVKDEPIDVYLLMELPSSDIMAHEIVVSTLSQKQADTLLKQGKAKKGATAKRLLLAMGDPAEEFLRKSAKSFSMKLELVPAPYLDKITAPIKQSFGYADSKESIDELDCESVKRMIPDSYDPCSCASGKKYKFCCKKIFLQIMEAMVATEEGNISEALEWIAKARAIVGETAEVLCREAIVYNCFDPQKSADILEKCLAVNPLHPRAHYIRGLTLKQQGDFQGAIKAYDTAIANYPPSDQYHLNEVYNNLGTAFHSMGDYQKAKSAWERALLFLPSDKVARRNLAEFTQ